MNIVGCVWLLVIFDLSASVQQLRRQATYSEVNPGGEVVLHCIVENKGGDCVWQKDRRVVGIYKGKYEWAGDMDNGDCSIRILAARTDLDDGLWECQVTATSFDSLDTVNSEPIPVIVRAPPESVQIVHKGETAVKEVTIIAGEVQYFSCTSENANPPPKLSWFLGDTELEGSANQTDIQRGKRWSSRSNLAYAFEKQDHQKNLRCEATHPALVKGKMQLDVRINAQYAPTVAIESLPSSELEEGYDNLFLSCVADSNPPATLMWRRDGNPDVISTSNKMGFYPLLRKNSGVYTCEAKNSVGTSNTARVEVDVKYAPDNVIIDGPHSANIEGTFSLQCSADSNPPAELHFFQKLYLIPETSLLRGEGNELVITNVSYSDQGEYHCTASNVINGDQRTVKSPVKTVRVTGPPQFSYQTTSRMVYNRNTDAVVQVEFCADPKPTKLLWKSNGFTLEPGEVFYDGKFLAEPLRQVRNTSCYEARLIIQRIDLHDANTYEVVVENELGSTTGTAVVFVREPVPMTAVIGVIGGCILFLILVTLCLLYAFRSDKWCFNGEDTEHKIEPDLYSSTGVRLRSGYASGNASGSPTKMRSTDASLRYSDLMLPRASNNGSMRVKKGQYALGLPSVTPIPSPSHGRSPSRVRDEMLTII